MTDAPLDRIAADGIVAERVVYYAALYPRLREVARQHGYALALHGSLTRDLDVIAVPWVDDAADEATLVEALTNAAGGLVPADGLRPDGERVPTRTPKPHGRHAWTILFGSSGGYIDLSVMPRAVSP